MDFKLKNPPFVFAQEWYNISMNTKINYQLLLDQELNKIKDLDPPKKLLLHSCCGPCSTYVLQYLSDYFEICVLYYNPNIFPDEEYIFRKEEQKDLIEKMPARYGISFVDPGHREEDFYGAIKGLEGEKEGGGRCRVCFDLRLDYAGKYALDHGFDYFTTTLTISPHKNSQILNQIGGEIGEKYGVKYLFSDFKKREGFKRSVELTESYGMYRQDYCGCEFSKNFSKKES